MKDKIVTNKVFFLNNEQPWLGTYGSRLTWVGVLLALTWHHEGCLSKMFQCTRKSEFTFQHVSPCIEGLCDNKRPHLSFSTMCSAPACMLGEFHPTGTVDITILPVKT